MNSNEHHQRCDGNPELIRYTWGICTRTYIVNSGEGKRDAISLSHAYYPPRGEYGESFLYNVGLFACAHSQSPNTAHHYISLIAGPSRMPKL